MKLYFEPGARPWQPERYRYAAEQMMLTLFPGERPEYPAPPPNMVEGGEAAACFLLEEEGERALVRARVCWQGRLARGEEAFPAGELDAPPERVYHVVQHALKLAFYRAGTALLGGAMFAYLHGLLPLMVVLAIPGFLGWMLPYFCYQRLRQKREQRIAPLIEQKNDEIYSVCERGCRLLST